jgi:hypothetical protein
MRSAQLPGRCQAHLPSHYSFSHRRNRRIAGAFIVNVGLQPLMNTNSGDHRIRQKSSGSQAAWIMLWTQYILMSD